jgi:hypothetical protein
MHLAQELFLAAQFNQLRINRIFSTLFCFDTRVP